MADEPVTPAKGLDLGKLLLPLLLQSMLSGKPITANDILPALLQGLTGQPLALPSPTPAPEPPPPPPQPAAPPDLNSMLLPLLIQMMTGKPMALPGAAAAQPAPNPLEPTPVPTPAIKTPAVQVTGAATVGTIIAQLAGLLPASVGDGATTAGVLTTAVPILATLLAPTGLFGSVFGGLLKLWKKATA